MAIAVLIPHDNRPLMQLDLATLEEYQEEVGGYVERINTGLLDTAFFANEDAKSLGMQLNRRATILWWLNTPTARQRDHIAGNVVVVGPVGRDCEVRDVPPDLIDLLFNQARHRVEITTFDEPAKWHRNEHYFPDFWEAGAWALDLESNWTDVDRVRVVAEE